VNKSLIHSYRSTLESFELSYKGSFVILHLLERGTPATAFFFGEKLKNRITAN
jgi:hypothetical protein